MLCLDSPLEVQCCTLWLRRFCTFPLGSRHTVPSWALRPHQSSPGGPWLPAEATGTAWTRGPSNPPKRCWAPPAGAARWGWGSRWGGALQGLFLGAWLGTHTSTMSRDVTDKTPKINPALAFETAHRHPVKSYSSAAKEKMRKLH